MGQLDTSQDWRGTVNMLRHHPGWILGVAGTGFVFLVLLAIALTTISFLEGGVGPGMILGFALLIVAQVGAITFLTQPLRLYPDKLRARRYFLPSRVIPFAGLSHFELREKSVQRRDDTGTMAGGPQLLEVLVPVSKEGTAQSGVTLPFPTGQNGSFLEALASDSGLEVRRGD